MNDNHIADNGIPNHIDTDIDNDSQINEHSNKNMLLDSENVVRKDGGYLELLEERPVVNKERLDVGQVSVTKHTRTKMINVPIELVEEYVTITTTYHDSESQDLLSGNYDDKDILRHVEPTLDSKAVITINGQQIEINDAPIEIVVSRQVATITKDTYVIQEVNVNKTVHTHTDTIELELRHEELDVNEEGFLAHDNIDKKL